MRKRIQASSTMPPEASVPSHMITAVASREKLNIVHIPFRGSGPATTALISGQVDMFLGTPSELLPQVASGKIRIRATSGAERLPNHRDVPTIAETVPGFKISAWNGLVAPTGTPGAMIDKMGETLIALANKPETAKVSNKLGVFPGGIDRRRSARIFAEDKASYGDALKAAGVHTQ